jgi:cell division protein FtsI (penicillin-binding protein 3)
MARTRLIAISLLLVIPAAAIMWRLFDIQVMQRRHYAAESRKQAQQRILISAHRGDLRDCKGRVLSSSIGMKMPLSALRSGNSGKNDVTKGTSETHADSALGSIAVKRVYPFGEAAGAVLGYVGKDGDGLGGAEFCFDKHLKGEDGWEIVMRDGRNRTYQTMNLPKKDPVNGSDVYLTIDIDIQKIVENVIHQAVEKLSAKGAMCIVMEPATGKILAMVSDPSFNPNLTPRYSLDQRSNKCVAYTYEPGSTFKVITAACALQEQVRKETDTIDGNHGVYEVYDEKIRDEKPYGRLSFTDALAFSSNVCFAKIAADIGSERLYRYARDFGLGDRSGIRLPGEECGIVHPVDKWSGRTLVTMAIGQEVSVTLLQMASIYAAVANEGVLCEPRIFDRIVSPAGTVVDSSGLQPVRRVIRQDIARRLKTMLVEVVKRGTGVKAAIPGVMVAGKTGTAQKIDKLTGTYSMTHGWSSFIGFAPVDQPQLLCAVLIDDPLHAEMGGLAAAPAFAKIMNQIISQPQLHYAERMLGRPMPGQAPARLTPSALATANVQPVHVPQLYGMPVERVCALLAAEKIPYEVIGTGRRIDNQEPAAGSELSAGATLVLYTSADGPAAPSAGQVMPDCRGRELRDAINSVTMRGLVPNVVGEGFVQRQFPFGGTLVRHAEACTLICSFNIAQKKL